MAEIKANSYRLVLACEAQGLLIVLHHFDTSESGVARLAVLVGSDNLHTKVRSDGQQFLARSIIVQYQFQFSARRKASQPSLCASELSHLRKNGGYRNA